jgi:diguanylate cyclase (GGDEF)-like protein
MSAVPTATVPAEPSTVGRILERAGDPGLTALARVGGYVTGAASVGIHILDAHHQHRVAGINAPLDAHPRRDSLCRLVVDGEERIVCADATREDRFAYSTHVEGPTPLRFFAAVPLRTSDGAVVGTLCAWDTVAREISDEQVARFEDLAAQVVAQVELTRIAVDLGHAATHDPLTGAVNRLVLSDRLAQAFGRQLRDRGDVFVALCDVDGFKTINDTLGHDAGDVVLREVVRRLLSCTRVQDTVARLGGDEFAVVAESGGGGMTAESLRRRIEVAMSPPMDVAGAMRPIGVTVGVALAEAGDDVRAALARADHAMYERKRAGSAARSGGTA